MHIGKKIQSKTLCSLLAASIIFSSIPTMVFAEDKQSTEPAITETSVLDASTEEQTTETTVVEETTVDTNVTSIPTDETTPTSEVVEDIEEPPITESSDATETSTETTVESTTKPTETTVAETAETSETKETTETSETTETTVAPEEKVNSVVVASSYDEYFELIAKLPDGVQRVIVDTTADLSSLDVDAGVYYDGTYILVFNTQAKFVTATNFIKNAGYTYAIDGTLSICDNTGNTTVATGKLNPNAKVRVAVIDTGSNNANEYYSVINEDTTDRNGHGTKMCNYILSETNDAYLISIKALNKDGDGQMSDVYAAVQMAEDLGVDYILMSISIRDGGNYQAFKDLIKNTKAKVVASAGNNGTNAKKYLPAGIDNVITVGAVRADSYIVSTSNYGECVNYYAPASSTSIAAAKVVGKIIANAYDLQTIAFMLDDDTYYLEGSEYHFSTDDYRFRHGAYYLLSASDLQYGDFHERMLQYCTSGSLSNADASYSYAGGFHAGSSKTYEPGGCIQFVMSATAWTAKNNENATFWTTGSDVNGYVDKSTGCSTFMRNAGFTANPTNYGADLDSAWNGTSSNYDKAIATNNQLYRYLRDYAKPGDIIMFGATWDSGTPWHHVAIYAGPAYYETPTADLPHPESYDDHWRYEYYFGGDTYPDNCYSCSVFYEATQSWPGFRAHMRIIGPSDFFTDRGDKDFDTVVILRGEEAPASVGIKLTKSVSNSYSNITTGNSCYSFEGTTYAIYDTEAKANAGTNPVATFTMNASGTSTTTYTATVGATYWAKEISAGKGLEVDTAIHKIVISSATSATIDGISKPVTNGVVTFNFEDIPQVDPFSITLRKVNNSGQKVDATLDGAVFRLYYYAQDLGTGAAPAQATVIYDIPVSSSTGVIYLSDLQALTPVGGSNPNYLKNLTNTSEQYPLGTVRIEEVTPPTGYNRSNQILRIRLLEDDQRIITNETTGGAARLRWDYTSNNTGVNAALPNQPSWEYYSLTKRVNNTEVTGVSGFTFNLYDATHNILIATGTSQNDGRVLWTYKYIGTDNAGYFGPDGTNLYNTETYTVVLPTSGNTYRVEEVKKTITKNNVTYTAQLPVDQNNAAWTDGNGVYYTTFQLNNPNGTKADTVTNRYDTTGFTVRKSDVSGAGIARTFNFTVYYYGNGATASVNRVVFDTFSITTNTNGEGSKTYSNIPTGWYEVVENNNQSGWVTTYSSAVFDRRAGAAGSATIDVVNSRTPSMSTQLTDNSTNSQVASLGQTVTMTDKVTYEGLEAGTYYVTGTLYDKSTNQPLKVNGQNVTGQATIVVPTKNNAYGKPMQQSGTVNVTYTFNTTGLAGKTFVAFEEIRTGSATGTVILEHKNINDTKQTIWMPSVSTTLTDNSTHSHTVAYNATTVTVTDNVVCNNLIVGQTYSISGELVRSNGTSTGITATDTFTATATSMTRPITYTINRSQVDNVTLTAYATLRVNNTTVAEHKDLSDAGQTVYLPKLSTVLQNPVNITSHVIDTVENNYQLTDVVTYSNAQPGATYRLISVLMDADTKQPFKDASGNTITITETVTASASGSGVWYVDFIFDGPVPEGTTLVAFEQMAVVYNNSNIVVASHEDYASFEQSVFAPSISTTLYDKNLTSDKDTARSMNNITLVDEVKLDNLVPNQSYTLTSTLVIKNGATGTDFMTKTTTFTASAKSQTVNVEFTGIDAIAHEGETFVCYETLALGYYTVAEHKNINDEAQTVHIPKIRTTLINVATNSHIVPSTGSVTLRDTVTFTNLVVGKTYTINGKLMYSDGTETGITATKTFTATVANGTETIDFTADGSIFKNKTVVAFEDLLIGSTTIATHSDLTDDKQTVYGVELGTTLVDAATNEHIVRRATNVKLVDTVTYKNITPNVSYTITGTLYNKATGEPVKVNGQNVTASKTFTPDSADGSVEIEFTIDTTNFAGETFVAFESLTYGTTEIANHNNINDVKQTVYVPDVHTTFYDKNLASYAQSARSSENITLIDEVEYSNLVPGKQYTLTGTIMVKDTTPYALKDASGNVIKVTKTFTPENANGTEKIEFTGINGKLLEGKTTVAFETLTYEGIDIFVHANIDDEKQTVKFPKIRTQLTSVDTTDSVVPTNTEVELVDKVTYENLVVGEHYVITGKLVYADGSGDVPNVTVIPVSFVAESANGTAEVTFKFNSSVLKNKTIVAFEDLMVLDVVVASHADLTDENQTVYIPEIHTTLLDKATDKHVSAQGEVTVIDSVSCNNLVVGKEYTLNGTLMNKKTGEALKNADGTPVTATATWTAEAKNEVKQLTFTFDSSLLEDGTGAIVAFESLKHNNIEITTHNDLTDFDQSVYIPDVYTELFDEQFVNTPEIRALTRNFKEVNLVDHVYFKNLTPRYTYTIYSGLYIREESDGTNNTPFCDAEGTQYTKTITFDPEDTDVVKNITVDPVTGAISGMIEVKYTIDATLLSGKHVVAYESIDIEGSAGSVVLVAHADPKNDYETVSIPEIGTTAKDKADGDQMLDGTKTEQTIVDTIAYSGLIPGHEYVATGKLVIKKDYAEGEEYEYVLDKNGNILTVSVPFTPDATNSTIDADTGAASGTVDVEFTFDASKYTNKYVVAFETVTYNGIEVAVHADINDEGQTVKIPVLLHVQIVKVDGDKVQYALKGAEITIYQVALDSEGKPVLNDKGEIDYVVAKDIDGKDCIAVTDKDGIVNFTVMYDEHFKYFAKETKAPKGYNINNKYFEILPTENRESNGICLIPIDIADFLIPPRTGDSMNLGLFITLSVLSAIGVCGGLYFIHKKKKSEEGC